MKNLKIRVIPIIYDSLPESDIFIKMCTEVVGIMNTNELFRFYNIKTVLAKDLFKYIPHLIKNIIPPVNTRFNSMDGWLRVDDKIRGRLGLLKSNDYVEEGIDIKYPNLPKDDILIAIIPADVRTTQDIYNQESHFGANFSLWGAPEKTVMIIYHVGILDVEGNIVDSKYKDSKIQDIAYPLIESIVEEKLGVNDVQMETVKIKFGYKNESVSPKNNLFERLRVLFYGNEICSFLTLKKAILLFDDIHFCDNPSISIGGNWGTIGHPSVVRRFIDTFASNNIPVFVHKENPVYGSLNNFIASEIEDKKFSKLAYENFKKDELFRNMLVNPSADYGGVKGHDIIKSILKLDLGNRSYPLEEYIDSSEMQIKLDNKESIENFFVQALIIISAKLTIACAICFEQDLIPFTEFSSLEQLLTLRYERALKNANLKKTSKQIKLVHLSQKIFDSVIPDNVLDAKSLEDVIKYRNATRKEYEKFRKYLMKLNYQIESNSFDSKFQNELKKLIIGEVIPEADKFKEGCIEIWEKMFGGMLKNVSVMPIGSTIVSYYTGKSWLEILAEGCLAGIVPPLIDAALEYRKVKRQNSLSYLLKVSSV